MSSSKAPGIVVTDVNEQDQLLVSSDSSYTGYDEDDREVGEGQQLFESSQSSSVEDDLDNNKEQQFLENSDPSSVENDHVRHRAGLKYPKDNEIYSNLEDLLRKYGRNHCGKEEPFWSTRLLARILTRSRVRKALELIEISGGDTKTIDSMCAAIVSDGAQENSKRYMKIFAILLLLGKEEDFKILFDAEICDECLPLTKVTNNGTLGLTLQNTSDILAFPKECKWRARDIDGFNTYQKQVSPQYFGLDLKNHNITDGTILPWLGVEVTKERGGYSTVKKYVIDPDSHEFHEILKPVTVSQQWVAVKTVHKARNDKDDKDGKRWLDEVKMLRRFSGKDHPHLITLLSSFTMSGENNLIFPCAEFDLVRFWENNPGLLGSSLPIKTDLMRWISRQMYGLMEALKFIHAAQRSDLDTENVYGKHGDLKAENILWFKSSDPFGILVITDLGLAEVHRDKSRSNIPNKDVPMTPGYRPPECDIEGGKLSRAFDIWTMGCMFLEMICWIIGGHKMIQEFEEARTSIYITGSKTDIFFTIEKAGHSDGYVVMVKESVTKWIVDLHANKSCTSFLHDMLRLIHNEMIVVLSPDTPRGSSRNLLNQMKVLYTKAQDKHNPDYIEKGYPENISKPTQLAFEVDPNSAAKKLIEDSGIQLKECLDKPKRVTQAQFKASQGY